MSRKSRKQARSQRMKHLRNQLSTESLLARSQRPRPSSRDAREFMSIDGGGGSDTATIRIFDEISWWGIEAGDIAEQIDAIDTGVVNTVNVEINSPGGYVYDGIAIKNMLDQIDAEVVVTVQGIAASIASVIAMAGDTVRMASGSRMMIHSPWSIAVGNAAQMREEADLLDLVQDDILDIYLERDGSPARAALAQMLEDETWMSAADAVEKGFADEVLAKGSNKTENKARFDLSAFDYRNLPEDLAAGGGGDDSDSEELEKDLAEMQERIIADAVTALTGLDQSSPGDSNTDDAAAEKKRRQQKLSLLRAMQTQAKATANK